jgi:hypothetical protein
MPSFVIISYYLLFLYFLKSDIDLTREVQKQSEPYKIAILQVW